MNNREIAGHLAAAALKAPEACYTDKKEVVFQQGSFTVRCIPEAGKIIQCAEKFLKPKKMRTSQRKDWGVWGSKLNAKAIHSRYADDPDQQQFLELIQAR